MKCEDVSKELVGYLDGRLDPGERRKVEGHLANCAPCSKRVEEMRRISQLLGELPAIEPSFGFDARLRQRVAAEPAPGWFWRLIPAPRPAFAVALLIALTVLVAKFPSKHAAVATNMSELQQEQDFNAIKNLGVLEDYDVLTKFDALAGTSATPSSEPDEGTGQSQESND